MHANRFDLVTLLTKKLDVAADRRLRNIKVIG